MIARSYIYAWLKSGSTHVIIAKTHHLRNIFEGLVTLPDLMRFHIRVLGIPLDNTGVPSGSTGVPLRNTGVPPGITKDMMYKKAGYKNRRI